MRDDFLATDDLGAPIQGYALLDLEYPKNIQVDTRRAGLINMEEECGLRIYTQCSNPNKSR